MDGYHGRIFFNHLLRGIRTKCNFFTGLAHFSIWLDYLWMISEVDLKMGRGGNVFLMDTLSLPGWWY